MEQTAKKNQTQKRSYPGDGRWIEKPRRSEVLVCSTCKGKYIKTRPGQTVCIRCLVRSLAPRV